NEIVRARGPSNPDDGSGDGGCVPPGDRPRPSGPSDDRGAEPPCDPVGPPDSGVALRWAIARRSIASTIAGAPSSTAYSPVTINLPGAVAIMAGARDSASIAPRCCAAVERLWSVGQDARWLPSRSRMRAAGPAAAID